ncbi:type VII secretion integral membrane protein EccD [Corynebacterium cystitidis]|uniref:type VII secretion integral membrane protein EccD n=1 Tax=Corynebacterium cystitidis TaxID=35757 RepID=UPI00211EEBFE|nr:type VII secretion integral membrane protein EccD [Corynebacterium cystitidis]
MASAMHHVVRVTVRLDIGQHHSATDVTLPSSSSLAEILPELTKLIDAPPSERPWEFTTVSGQPLDQHAPLHNLDIADGSIVVMRPEIPYEPPVVRDAAEALVVQAGSLPRSPALEQATAIVVAVGLIALLSVVLPAPVACTIGAVVILLLGVYTAGQALITAAVVGAGVATGAWVAGGESSLTAVAVAVAVACCTWLVAVGVAAYFRLVGTRVTTTTATTSLVILSGCVGAWLPGGSAPAALSMLVGLLVIMAVPGVATQLAGLSIPRVPTAGEPLPDAHDHQPDVDLRARHAHKISDGMYLGVAIGMVPGFAQFAWRGGEWTWLLCLCLAGAIVIHASRHNAPIARMSLMAVAIVAVTVASVSLTRDVGHPVVLAFGVVIALAVMAAPLWAGLVSRLEPTTVVWFERAEQAAIIAVIPLAIHVAGIFTMIRGLG